MINFDLCATALLSKHSGSAGGTTFREPFSRTEGGLIDKLRNVFAGGGMQLRTTPGLLDATSTTAVCEEK